MCRTVACCAVLLTTLSHAPVAAQEAVGFGDWRAFCAPVAGCVLGVKADPDNTLAFVEPPFEDGRLLLILREPVVPGTDIAVSLDGQLVVTLGPADGWRVVDSAVGPAIQIAPSIAREGLMEPMRRRNWFEILYRTAGGDQRRVTFSLNGYADTRSYADDG